MECGRGFRSWITVVKRLDDGCELYHVEPSILNARLLTLTWCWFRLIIDSGMTTLNKLIHLSFFVQFSPVCTSTTLEKSALLTSSGNWILNGINLLHVLYYRQYYFFQSSDYVFSQEKNPSTGVGWSTAFYQRTNSISPSSSSVPSHFGANPVISGRRSLSKSVLRSLLSSSPWSTFRICRWNFEAICHGLWDISISGLGRNIAMSRCRSLSQSVAVADTFSELSLIVSRRFATGISMLSIS